MKKIIATLCLLFTTAVQANSIRDWFIVNGIEVEAGLGQSTAGMPPNGVYHQRHSDGRGPYVFDLQSPSYYLGLTGYATGWMRWRAGYQYLGNFTGNALAVQDERFTGSGCVPEGCGGWRRYISDATYRGLRFSLAPEKRIGDFKVFVEAGFLLYIPKLDVTTMRDDQSSVEVGHYHYKNGWQASPLVGVGVENVSTRTLITAGWQQINIVNGVRNDDVTLNTDNTVFTVMLVQRF